MISLRSVEYYHVLYSIVWCDINFCYTMYVCIDASRRASHRGSRGLAGGDCWEWARWRQVVPLITSFLPSHVIINHNDLHRLILMGPNRLAISIPCFTTKFLGSTCYCFMWFGYGDIHYSCLHFYYQFIIYCSWYDHYINGNMENHPEKQCYHKVGMGRPWLIN
jgi:hypothetical protein